MSTPCGTSTCTDDCLHQPCSPGRCNVGRKHYRRGGVCCMTCHESCARCGGAFYIEDTTADPDDADGIDRLCHCCAGGVR